MNLAKTFFDISLLQAKPQDLPFSHAVFVGALIASILSYVLALGPVGSEVTRILGRDISIVPLAVAENLFYAATVWMILRFRSHSERFIQTATAMFGVNTIMQLIMWPVTGWLLTNQGTPGASLPAFLIFAIRIWILIIYAHIFKETLETRFGMGVVYTIISWMLTSVLLVIVFDIVS